MGGVDFNEIESGVDGAFGGGLVIADELMNFGDGDCVGSLVFGICDW